MIREGANLNVQFKLEWQKGVEIIRRNPKKKKRCMLALQERGHFHCLEGGGIG